MFREKITEEPQIKVWRAYEESELLKFRCQAGAVCKIIASIFFAALGKFNRQQAVELMAS